MDALSDRWGTSPHGAGKVVWFELDLPGRESVGPSTRRSPGLSQCGRGIRRSAPVP